jgi:hypothetical protein
MYGALWRVLPGPVWVRILIVLGLIAGVLFVLAAWVFPFIDSIMSGQTIWVGT